MNPGGTEATARILDEFARRTGLEGGVPPRRYLWTDAFAVCGFLALHQRTDDAHHLERARALVDQVHHVLGRHRADDSRRGWISGLDEAEGEARPTAGGLRIGKPLPERGDHERLDERLEWDRDGQYFHYLTRWMHALERLAHVSGETRYHRWAAELAAVSVARFGQGPAGTRRLAWKMTIDLRHPAVPSSGQHDALDGLVTLIGLQSSSARDPQAPDLSGQITELERMCLGTTWVTDDALGIGGLLCGAHRVAGFVAQGARERATLLSRLCDEAVMSLTLFSDTPQPRALEARLPFRELGLALGLHAVERLAEASAKGEIRAPVAPAVAAMFKWTPLARRIEETWLDPASQRVSTWTGHEDINAVMLAVSLAPEGYLGDGLRRSSAS